MYVYFWMVLGCKMQFHLHQSPRQCPYTLTPTDVTELSKLVYCTTARSADSRD